MANNATAFEDGTLTDPANRAAVLLMSLGEQEAANVLKYMGPKEVQRVGTAMSSLSNVTVTDSLVPACDAVRVAATGILVMAVASLFF